MSTLRLTGASSGYTEITAPAVAGNNTMTLPSSNGSVNAILKNGATPGLLEYATGVVIDSLGRVGIGTTSPGTLLDVVGVVTGQSFIPTSATVPANGLYLPAANAVGIATGSSERIRITNTGTILAGSTSAVGDAYSPSGVRLFTLVGSSASFGAHRNDNTQFSNAFIFTKARGTGLETVQSGDTLGILTFQAANGTAFARAAGIEAYVDGTPSSTSMPGRLSLYTTPAGSNTPVERLRIANDGTITVPSGTLSAALSGNASTATALSSSRTFALTGDVTGSANSDLSSGASIAVSIAAGVIVDADVNAAAAIAGTKISPSFGSQTISTTGTIELGHASDTTLSRSSAGVLAVEGVVVPTISSTNTLTNKTLTDPAIIGTILEDVFTITDGAAFEVDPGNGSIQLITLGASRVPKATNFLAGESVTLMVADGTNYTLTWTDATWGTGGVKWTGGTAPTLATTGYTVLQFWKVSTQVYGAYVGDVA